ncbi:conserved hypothetical protein [Hahella chejuensis KCTC 2396]|uniref:Uncharacterized protein n=1 Tax=Hahella chejuensis (strain KCTC 2396) TaxID=349521 RepID=Q2SC93_HAHCH|nr:hypothetical protein [Hahella chejuensis]ABC31731.1 conserved hypothetical protein [Hahella chejuensis KCTC 2396]
MGNSLSNELVMEIGSIMLGSEEYEKYEWAGIALVGNFSHGQQRMNGYVYLVDGDYQAAIPSVDALRKIKVLRDEMAKAEGREWHQCLIHITRPDYKINIQFEYDDPDRWKLKNISRDMREYADFLKPEM